MGLLHLFNALSRYRFSWLLLLLLGFFLEGCGLYFQYQLRLPLCVNCVYERAFYLCFILAGLIGILGSDNALLRNIANFIFMGGSIGGAIVAFDHINYSASMNSSSCQLAPNFPSYLKLDEWMPWMFQPTVSCEKLDWTLLGFDMPTWILISFACGALFSVLFFISQFFKKKRSHDFSFN